MGQLGTDNLRGWIAVMVATIWFLAAIVAFFTANFEELGIITPVMMIVVGFVFGYRSGANNIPPHEEDH